MQEVQASDLPEINPDPAQPRVGSKTAARPRDFHRFKESIRNGKSLQQCMLDSGFPLSVAKMGMRRLPKSFRRFVLQEKAKIGELSRLFRSELPEFIEGSLIQNVIDGQDTACKSLELLGKQKHVALFTPDSQAGIIVIQPPPAMMEAIQARIQQQLDTSQSQVINMSNDGHSGNGEAIHERASDPKANR